MKWISVYLIDKKDNKQTSEIQTHTFCNVITIAREYGCGGRIIGKMVAEKLGYEFYDTNLIELIALRLKLVKEAAEVKKIWVRELSIPNVSAFCLNQDMTLQQSMICLTDLLKIS